MADVRCFQIGTEEEYMVYGLFSQIQMLEYRDGDPLTMFSN